MTHIRVYVALAEVRPLQGCGALDPAEICGAFVRSYIPAVTEEQALARLRKAVSDDHLALVQVKWIVDEAKTEWEHPTDVLGRQLVDDARKSGQVTYGRFDTWTHGKRGKRGQERGNPGNPGVPGT